MDQCSLQISDEFRQVRKSRRQFHPSTFNHISQLQCRFCSPSGFCSHISKQCMFLHPDDNIHFNAVPPLFSFISTNPAFVSCVFCTSPAPTFHLALLQTLEARSCCCASICCCCLAAISCNSASVMSMRGAATLEKNTHL